MKSILQSTELKPVLHRGSLCPRITGAVDSHLITSVVGGLICGYISPLPRTKFLAAWALIFSLRHLVYCLQALRQ